MSSPQVDLLSSPLARDPVLCQVAKLFVEELPARIERMQKWFELCEWHSLRHAVRNLGRDAAQHGYDQLVAYAAEVEYRLTRRAATPEIGEALKTLAGQCRRLAAEAR
jgi:Hpt domain